MCVGGLDTIYKIITKEYGFHTQNEVELRAERGRHVRQSLANAATQLCGDGVRVDVVHDKLGHLVLQ